MVFDVRFTASYFQVVNVPNSENIQNLLQIAITNENTVASEEDPVDKTKPNGRFRGRAYMRS